MTEVVGSIEVAKVQAFWEEVVYVCTRVLHQADVYGFTLMHLPDPNVQKVAKTLQMVVVPILDKLLEHAELPSECNIQLINSKQYVLHLKNIARALELEDEGLFDEAVSALRNEAMIG